MHPRPHLTALVRSLLHRLDLELLPRRRYLQETDANRSQHDLDFLAALDDAAALVALRNLEHSRSQLRQDLFVLTELRCKRGGFFVEFGAASGEVDSNTHLLEKRFGWQGILAEPARGWHAQLRRNRSGVIDLRCVWRASGERLEFVETPLGELSTLSDFARSDGHADDRAQGTRYLVETVSLLDLLDQHHAPRDIDYLSIDTEGSELDILSAFDFDRYRFSVITCEHNRTPAREQIHDLLGRHGYVRKLEAVSRWDDWYVRAG